MYGSAFCLRLTLSSSFCLRRWYFLCKTSCASSFALSWVASLSHSSFILSSLRRRIPHSSLSEAASAWWSTQLRNGHHAKKTNKKTKKNHQSHQVLILLRTSPVCLLSTRKIHTEVMWSYFIVSCVEASLNLFKSTPGCIFTPAVKASAPVLNLSDCNKNIFIHSIKRDGCEINNDE